jgi:conjugal transfer pilus assembly protein TraL
MDNNEKRPTRMYKYADAPIMLGDWQIDQVVLTVTLIYLTFALTNGFTQTIVGIIAAIGASWLYAKYKRGAVRGKGRQILYSHGLKKPNALIPCDKRYFVGG